MFFLSPLIVGKIVECWSEIDGEKESARVLDFVWVSFESKTEENSAV